MVGLLSVVLIICILSVIILYILYFKILHSNLKVSFPILLFIVIGILLAVTYSIVLKDNKKDNAILEYETLIVQINTAETYDDCELAYNNAVYWLDKTNGHLIDGATKEQRDEIEKFVDYYNDYFK